MKPLRSLDFPKSTEIFEVEDRLGGLKIMKVLKSDLPRLVEALEREATVLQILRHPGIPKVEEGGYFSFIPNQSLKVLHCLVMEKFAGPTLQEWLGDNNLLSGLRTIDWLRQMATILDCIHRASLFHQDIKPANIILRPDGRLGLIDFGTVGVVDRIQLGAVGSGFESDDAAEIAPMGTVGYIAPEQGKGKAVPQSDFYSLGCTFVHLMTGVAPYRLPDDPKTGTLLWRNRAPKSGRKFADLIDELMAEFPGDRPKNTQILLRSLERLQQRERLYKSPIFWPSVIAAVLLAAAAVDKVVDYLVSQYNFEQASIYLGMNQHQLARSYLERYIDQNPQDADAYINLALACQNMHDYRCASDNYQEALKRKPNSWEAHYNLGTLYDEQGNYTAAVIEYEESIQLDANQAVGARNNLSRIRNLQGRYREAEALAQQGLKQTNEPDRQAALYKNLGWAKLGMRQYTAANKILWQALRLDPLRTDAYCLLAEVEEAKNNELAARQLRQKCLQYTGS